jgi:hypothetical protein
MQSDKNIYEKIIEAIDSGKLNLTTLDEVFLKAVGKKLDAGRELRKEQRRSLDKICERINPW